MSSHNSTKAVLFALTGNGVISVMKYVAAFFTGSASMMAEAVHSTADCMNQIFLLIGEKRSKRENDELHPFGYGREEFFWAFIVAILLFFLGSIYSIYEGIHKLMNPEPIKHFWWAVTVLCVSSVIEYKTFMVAYKQMREKFKGNLLEAIKKSVDINLIVILLEDSAALFGLIAALLSTLLSLYYPIFDAIGSILVGAILAYVSYALINELRKLIVGESMPRDDRKEIKEIVSNFECVSHVNRIKSMEMGRNQFLLLISINFEDDFMASSVEETVEQMKTNISKKFPNVSEIFIEISNY
jgi:cation diffusion facilitator family transporter